MREVVIKRDPNTISATTIITSCSCRRSRNILNSHLNSLELPQTPGPIIGSIPAGRECSGARSNVAVRSPGLFIVLKHSLDLPQTPGPMASAVMPDCVTELPWKPALEPAAESCVDRRGAAPMVMLDRLNERILQYSLELPRSLINSRANEGRISLGLWSPHPNRRPVHRAAVFAPRPR